MSKDNKATHTPGPWESHSNGYINIITAPQAYNVDICGTFGAMISHGEESYWIRQFEDKANARLIAAAPELLEALKALVADIDCRIQDDPMPDISDALAAIAKAEGREP